MLRITCDELDDLRIKLLAAVLTGALQGQIADLALLLAKDLDGLSTLMSAEGESFALPSPHDVAQALETLIEVGAEKSRS